ncbi:MAG: hypothetical protein AB1758_20070, partial [Candidatus Eremiobacterota bacterium]
MAHNDVLIARGVGRPVEDLTRLAPPAPLAGGVSGLPLAVLEALRQRPELGLAEENADLARRRLGYYDTTIAAPQDKLFSLESERFSSHWARHAEEFRSKQLLVGLGAGVTLSLAASFLLPSPFSQLGFLGLLGGFWGATRLARPLIERGINKKIETAIRSELAVPQQYWQQQLATREALKGRLEDYLAVEVWNRVQKDPDSIARTGVQEKGDLVIVGGVRVARKQRPVLQLDPAPAGPSGFDAPDAKGERS